jgi:hypothetical protein
MENQGNECFAMVTERQVVVQGGMRASHHTSKEDGLWVACSCKIVLLDPLLVVAMKHSEV